MIRERKGQADESITPTEETQRIRVHQAEQAVGGRQVLESTGFFERTGIDPEIDTTEQADQTQDEGRLAELRNSLAALIGRCHHEPV